jgi:heme oxygenase
MTIPCEQFSSNTSPAIEFQRTVETAIKAFATSRLLQRANAGQVEMHHYHSILCTLFHQTYSGPYTFARAAVNCNWRHEAAKEYLLRHAEEERAHWRWILDDLKATGYEGPALRNEPPHYSTQAYVGLNYYIAEQFPVARLATAAVLEGIGAALGGQYGSILLQALKLQRSQASFFLSHAETDLVHTAELSEVIAKSCLTAEEWRWMNHAAGMAGMFYRAMYDHEAFS